MILRLCAEWVGTWFRRAGPVRTAAFTAAVAIKIAAGAAEVRGEPYSPLLPPLQMVFLETMNGLLLGIIVVELVRMGRYRSSPSWSLRKHFAMVVALGTALSLVQVSLALLGRAEAYYDRGRIRAHKGDLYGALADLDRSVDLDPRNGKAHGERGWVRSRLGDYERAILDYTKAVELDPTDAQPFYNRCWTRGEKGDLDGAVEDCTRAVELDPGYVNAYQERGWLRSQRNDFEAAIKDYTRAIQLDPGCTKAYAGRGTTRYWNRDFEGAVEDWEAVTRLEPELRSELEPAIADARERLDH
jgi:tetratricopeptide (TPR) repeat protein